MSPAHGMSRRAWLQALAAIAAAGGPLAAGPARADDPEGIWDVVVVGSGMAGHCAAISARLEGARSVLMLEKAPVIGGHTAMASGSLAFVDPPRQAAQGIVDSVEKFTADARAVGNDIDEPLVRLIAGRSAGDVSWLVRQGVRFSPTIFRAFGNLQKRCVTAFGNMGARRYILDLHARSRSLGVESRLLSRVTSIRGEAGDFLLEVQDLRRMAGEALRARRVVLATGGFTANLALRMYFHPEPTHDLPTTANPHGVLDDPATGDGLYLARELGAAWVDMDKIVLLSYWGGRMLDYIGGEVYVNAEGERFVDETASTGDIARAIARLPERVMYVITDAQSIKGVNAGAKLTAGNIHRADSIEEMARDMGVSSMALRRTLERFNEAARSGSPDEFGRTAYTQTIEKPPFYWGREQLMMHSTLGGLHIDARARVLRADGSAIDGLYAAGETAGGIWGSDRLGGTGLLQCLVMGRIAGAEAGRRVG